MLSLENRHTISLFKHLDKKSRKKLTAVSFRLQSIISERGMKPRLLLRTLNQGEGMSLKQKLPII